MDDTKSILMMVLHKIFEKQPEIIERTFQLIHSFNNGKIDKNDYEKILKKICDLMNDQLPSPLLIYILTLVDMPIDNQSEIIEKMRKTLDILPDIKPYLFQYMNNSKQTIDKSNDKCIIQKKIRKHSNNLKLLDICANYVMKNKDDLKRLYRRKQVKIWRLINSNKLAKQQLQYCYTIVKDLNRKIKLLRHIESNKITTKLIEEYTDIGILTKLNEQSKTIDPFVITPQYEKTIEEYVYFIQY